jgi:organic radical activating enzyme
MPKYDTFNLVPGLTCNLTCPHCVNESGPTARGSLAKDERDKIVAALNRIQPKTMLLTGGEPTVYLESINEILGKLTFRPRVILTTNGTYALTLEQARAKLDQMPILDGIQLSFDPHHESTLDSPLPAVLKQYCEQRGLEFVVIVSMSRVMDLTFAAQVEEKYQAPVIIQKIEGSGRARKTGVEFQYEVFDPAVLNERCPNSSAPSYIQGKGFTVCCSNVVYNLPGDQYAEKEFGDLERSAFHREVTGLTFGERMKKQGLRVEELEPRHSSPCNLCEHLVLRACKSQSTA